MELRQVFDDIIRFETDMWNGIDARLRRDCGVSLGSLDVLRAVQRTPACRVNDVADELSITIGGASQAVDRLESKGYVARRRNPDDRRSSVVELTEAGTAAVDQAVLVFDEELVSWLSEAAHPDDLAHFARTLAGLRAARRAPKHT